MDGNERREEGTGYRRLQYGSQYERKTAVIREGGGGGKTMEKDKSGADNRQKKKQT